MPSVSLLFLLIQCSKVCFSWRETTKIQTLFEAVPGNCEGWAFVNKMHCKTCSASSFRQVTPTCCPLASFHKVSRNASKARQLTSCHVLPESRMLWCLHACRKPRDLILGTFHDSRVSHCSLPGQFSSGFQVSDLI